MNKLISLLLIFFISSGLVAQTEPVTGNKFLDNGKFDSTFRRYSTYRLPSSYFVITFNPTLSSLTHVPEVIKAYREIRLFAKYIPIYIIYLNAGVVTKELNDEEKYFNEIFFINKKNDENVHFLKSTELYQSLNVKTLMTKWYYIYNYRLIGGANSIKLHSLSDYNNKLPKDIIGLGEPRKIKINPKNLRLSIRRDLIRPYENGKLLYITDMNNNLNILNINTGNFEKEANKKEFDYLDFYCKKISKNENNCLLAKKNTGDNFNRDPNYFSGALFQDGFVYVSTGFEVTVPWESSVYKGLKFMTYINELGEKQKVKNEFIGEAYPAIIKFDTTLNYVSAYYVNTNSYPEENRVPNKAGFWGGLDRGFYIKDSLLIIDNNPDYSVPIKTLPKNAKKMYSIFKLDKNNIFNFEKFLPVEYADNYLNYINWHSRTYYIKHKGLVFGNLLNGGQINKLSDDFSTHILTGLGDNLIKETIPAFAEDTTKFSINFRSLCLNSIMNDRYILAIYYFQNKPVFELLEFNEITKKMKTVQVTDLSHTDGFEKLELNASIPNNGDGLCISNNKVYMTVFEHEEYYLYEYPIVQKRKFYNQSE
jgi:hypothetical protein